MSHLPRGSTLRLVQDGAQGCPARPVIETGERLDSEPAKNTWQINGWPALVIIWTREEWARLRESERPKDALPYRNGCYAALRIA